MSTTVVQPAQTVPDLALPLRELADTVRDWFSTSEWTVTETQGQIEVGPREAAVVPVLTIDRTTMGQRVVLEPVGRTSEGRWVVEFYAWPTLYRVRLMENGGEWRIRTDSGIYLRQAWNGENLRQLADDLINVDSVIEYGSHPQLSQTDEERSDRLHKLIDQEFLGTLTEAESQELARLLEWRDAEKNAFYQNVAHEQGKL